ncbi:nucleoside deaminase [Pseudonocardia sp. ICBG1122]|nr:nucleoside deaminase [Pseudonocardia pini]
MIDEIDRRHLVRAVALAGTALASGHRPFGALLVDGDGRVRVEDHNRAGGGDASRHAEIALARWAARHLDAQERAEATVYTSTEHCPMCAAAHGWVGLGRIVYASSVSQVTRWLQELGAPPWPVRPRPVPEVVPGALVDGPVDDLAEQVRALHAEYHR